MSLTPPKPQSVLPTVLNNTPIIRSATKHINTDYGSSKDADISSIRKKFAQRMQNLSDDMKSEYGISATGGGDIVTPFYDRINPNQQNPYARGGYVSLLNAYGENAGFCKQIDY